MYTMVGFLVGLFLGILFGTFFVCAIFISKEEVENAERNKKGK